MTTTLDPSFLAASMLMQDFKPRRMVAAKGGLLWMALTRHQFTAADLPPEITLGSAHIAGAATGALIAEGLLVAVARTKSPKPAAKGRKLDVLQLADGKRGTARAWLIANQFPVPPERAPQQRELFQLSA